MTHRFVGNLFATFMAVLTGVAVMYISVKYLREPQIPLDWAVMVFSGIITGIFMFFIIWGHFQSPKPTDPKDPGK